MITSMPVGLLGAVQRSAPAVAYRFLSSIDSVPSLGLVEFGVVRSRDAVQSTLTMTPQIGSSKTVLAALAAVCKRPSFVDMATLSLSAEGSANRRMWSVLVEASDASSLQLWWHLCCLRRGGPMLATAAVLSKLKVTDRRLRAALLAVGEKNCVLHAATSGVAVVIDVRGDGYAPILAAMITSTLEP